MLQQPITCWEESGRLPLRKLFICDGPRKETVQHSLFAATRSRCVLEPRTQEYSIQKFFPFLVTQLDLYFDPALPLARDVKWPQILCSSSSSHEEANCFPVSWICWPCDLLWPTQYPGSAMWLPIQASEPLFLSPWKPPSTGWGRLGQKACGETGPAIPSEAREWGRRGRSSPGNPS